MSFKAHFDTRALAAQVDALREDVDAATRPAAQAGSQVLYDAVKANVPRSSQGHWFHGTSFKKTGTKYWFDAGTLSKSIYQVYSKDNSPNGMATYQISWNHRKAPYGHMVEYGTRRTRPVAFVRRAALQMPAALQAAETEFMRRLKVFK
jgi:HK97 gp10 family phage protein